MMASQPILAVETRRSIRREGRNAAICCGRAHERRLLPKRIFRNRQDRNSVFYRGGPARARFACQSLGQPSLPVRRLAFWIQRQSESQPNAGTQHPTPGTRFGRRCPLAADDRQASQSGCCSACIGAGASCSVPGSRPSQTTMLSMSVTPRSRISSPSGPTVRRSESAISSWLAIR